MTARPLHFALLGTGNIAGRQLAPALSQAPSDQVRWFLRPQCGEVVLRRD